MRQFFPGKNACEVDKTRQRWYVMVKLDISRRGSQEVRQRSAKSLRPVRFRSTPPFFLLCKKVFCTAPFCLENIRLPTSRRFFRPARCSPPPTRARPMSYSRFRLQNRRPECLLSVVNHTRWYREDTYSGQLLRHRTDPGTASTLRRGRRGGPDRRGAARSYFPTTR